MYLLTINSFDFTGDAINLYRSSKFTGRVTVLQGLWDIIDFNIDGAGLELEEW